MTETRPMKVCFRHMEEILQAGGKVRPAAYSEPRPAPECCRPECEGHGSFEALEPALEMELETGPEAKLPFAPLLPRPPRGNILDHALVRGAWTPNGRKAPI